jgi:hypothetical protein
LTRRIFHGIDLYYGSKKVRKTIALSALIPFALNAGLMKPRKGLTPVLGKENWGCGQDLASLLDF